MSTWANPITATLKVRKAGSTTETVAINGVNADANAGTPETFLAAANHLLDIAGMSATITGMTREFKQEVAE